MLPHVLTQFAAQPARSTRSIDLDRADVSRAAPQGSLVKAPPSTGQGEGATGDEGCSGRGPATGPPRGRRGVLLHAASLAVALSAARPAEAGAVPGVVDRTWEAIGGGPADLTFPADPFLGVWDVESVLAAVELPLGAEFVPDMAGVQRAQAQDLNRTSRYQVAFAWNIRGQVVPDRRFNTASLVASYMGGSQADAARSILWEIDSPNTLTLALPGGTTVGTRVTRRLEEAAPPADARLQTSEFVQQTFDAPGRETRVKASRCFTKYHWRSAAAAGEGRPQVVATQVVSDYLTASDDPGLMMRAHGEPVVVYTYRMSLTRAGAGAAVPAGGAGAAAPPGPAPS